MELALATISCPYCAEEQSIDIDCSVEHQHYIEDCQICCRPISLATTVIQQPDGDYQISVSARHEND